MLLVVHLKLIHRTGPWLEIGMKNLVTSRVWSFSKFWSYIWDCHSVKPCGVCGVTPPPPPHPTFYCCKQCHKYCPELHHIETKLCCTSTWWQFASLQVLPPLGNTTFEVVFLARLVGSVENTLFIHTSKGVYPYQVCTVSHGVLYITWFYGCRFAL